MEYPQHTSRPAFFLAALAALAAALTGVFVLAILIAVKLIPYEL
jgi:hypothetical protein